MTIDPNDPRLTAFVLGELDPTERCACRGGTCRVRRSAVRVEEIRLYSCAMAF